MSILNQIAGTVPLGDPPLWKPDLLPTYPLKPQLYPLNKNFNILGGLFDPPSGKKNFHIYGQAKLLVQNFTYRGSAILVIFLS